MLPARLHPGGVEAASPGAEAQPLLRRLGRLATLSPAEQAMIAELGRGPLRELPARAEIHPEGVCPPPAALLSGWACRIRMLADGRRQIVAFLLPGDLIGRPPPCLPAPCAALALTRVLLADAQPLFAAGFVHHPPVQTGLGRALRAAELQEEILLRDQVVRLGRQTAYERLASLLLELRQRLEMAGLAQPGRFALPLTQEVLADALGLSVVHINRTVQQMRRDRLIELRGGQVIILQPEALQSVADWQDIPGLRD
ncbi:Crp/Fnr family transcriptional regulator [Roseomonas sp. 18066]|uniref:Crp/Fnr family transcriptional regulator n=1 Tax=Roseomonas sp. 18066 TaxID=2681412 RepID=UPI00135CDC7A|nr:Crp/Fnr family transcriptional regulator [Roseomonas sp. 18066]